MEDRRVNDSKLDDILRAVGEIKTSIAVFAGQIESLQGTAKENKEAIKGNGKAGLETRTTLLEKQMNLISWIGGVLFLAIIGDIMTLILN